MDALNQDTTRVMGSEETTKEMDAAIEVWDVWMMQMIFEERLLGSKLVLN